MFNAYVFVSAVIIALCISTVVSGGVFMWFNRYWAAKLVGFLLIVFGTALLSSHIAVLAG